VVPDQLLGVHDGLVVTVFTLVLTWPYVWLRHFAFG
jgi:hypothetical protein